MTTSPQDDLTAERAATDMYNRLFSVMHLPEHEHHAKARLKLFHQVTRQAALREASQVVRNRALLWRSHGGAKVGFPYGHLTIEGEYESMADELDRLASEGAPAPIDLLPKLKDDGGYGEHF